MQRELTAYAEKHPKSFRDLLAGYDQLLALSQKPENAEVLAETKTKLAEKQWIAARNELERRMARVNGFLEAMQPHSAAEYLNAFPDQLRTEAVDELIRKAAREIPGPNQDARRPFLGPWGVPRPGLNMPLRNGAP